jgi:large subunit ribosomal protein L24
MAATGTAHKTVGIRRNDTVKVMSGKDKGKQGRVLRVFPDTGRVLVEHVAVVKKTMSTKRNPRSKGGIADQESAISISKVQLVCGTCGPVRIGHEVRGDRKVRVCKKCGTTLDKG